jgi:hypothetical protein
VDEDIMGSEKDTGAEYELTEFCRDSAAEMMKLASVWIARMRASTLKADFETAIYNCDISWMIKVAKR